MTIAELRLPGVRTINATMYEGTIPPEPSHPALLIFPDPITIEEFQAATAAFEPLNCVPPWKAVDAGWTSRAYDRARSCFGKPLGIVISGSSDSERVDFFVWAQGNHASPLVLLPHKTKPRSRQIQELVWPGYINPDTWIHLPYPEHLGSFDPQENYPGRYTTGTWL